MTCASCTSLIERESKKIIGIKSINVSFASEQASLEVDETFDEFSFKSMLESIGYRIVVSESSNQKKSIDSNLMASIILISIGTFFMVGMFSKAVMENFHAEFNLIQIIISFLIIIFYGRHYFKSLKLFLTKFYSDMHTLIGLGIFSNFIYSISMFLANAHSHLFVEAIPFIIGFTKLGFYFEKLAKTKAMTSFSNLYKLQIKFSNMIIDGKTESVPVVDLRIGNIIRIKPGEKVPVNGIVIKGESHLDEALISGESIPLSKGVGDKVIAGGINLEGTLDVEVTHEFNQSSVAEIIHQIEFSDKNKTEIEKTADLIVGKFVPTIIVIAFITFFVWYFLDHNVETSLKHFIAVLVIACPCALGLAAPMSVMISTRKAFNQGLLISGGEILEIGSKVNTVVFDKTGTLTSGKPIVSQLNLQNGLSEKEFLFLVGSAASYSAHPLSLAVVEYAKKNEIKLTDPDKFKNLVGLGFSSFINNQNLLVGNKKLLESNGVDLSFYDEANCGIGSTVLVAIDGKFAGFFLINDPIKPEAHLLIKSLKELKIDIWMLTGDNELIARDIAHKLNITNVKSQVSPKDKAAFIKSLKNDGKIVAMIGDGINDSIALKEANVSMAMSDGSDIAISASQVSILNGDISLINDFFKIAKSTMKIIKENLFFSFIYNLLCIPLAAGLFVRFGLDLDPKWAAISMGLSSTSVILSSLRLKK
jgi:Cu+-exporting ATPase